jgi:hypothetical protein
MGVVWSSKPAAGGGGSGDVVHTRQILSGAGLLGGGDLSADRTLSIDPAYIQYATANLSSAQILALNTTPVQVLAAPGAGKMIELISVATELIFGTVAYSTNGGFRFYYGNTSGARANWSQALVDTVLTQTASSIGITLGCTFANLVETPARLLNQAIIFTYTANPTLGDGTAIFKIAYRVHSGF